MKNYLSNCEFIISGNGNALGDVLGDNYDRIREFFQTETDAFIIAASLSYFGMDKVTDDPTKNCISDELKNASDIETREWFHSQVCSMLEIYVMDSMVTLEEQSHIWWRSSNEVILDAKESTSLRNAEFATNRNATVCLQATTIQQHPWRIKRPHQNQRTTSSTTAVSI